MEYWREEQVTDFWRLCAVFVGTDPLYLSGLYFRMWIAQMREELLELYCPLIPGWSKDIYSCVRGDLRGHELWMQYLKEQAELEVWNSWRP